MAAPARTAPPSKSPPAKGPSGKDAAGKGSDGKPQKGKRPEGPPDGPNDVPPSPPAADRTRILKLALIVAAALSALLVAGVGLYVGLGREPVLPPLTVEDVSPPTPAPRPPAIGPVRQGDLNDELWRRMGVRPEGE
jgi:hypothetical protein